MTVLTTSAGATIALRPPIPAASSLVFAARDGRRESVKHDGASCEVPQNAEAGTLVRVDPDGTDEVLLELRVVSQYGTVEGYHARHPDTLLSDEAIVALLRRASASIDTFCGVLRAVWRTETHPYNVEARIYPRRNPIQEISSLAFGYPGLARAAPWPYTDYDRFHEVPAQSAFIVRDLRYIEVAYASRYRFYEMAFDPYRRIESVQTRIQARLTYLGGYLPADMPFEIEDLALDVAGGIERADETPAELVGVSSIHQGSQSYSIDTATRYGSGGPAGITPAIAATLQQYRNGGAGLGGRLA